MKEMNLRKTGPYAETSFGPNLKRVAMIVMALVAAAFMFLAYRGAHVASNAVDRKSCISSQDGKPPVDVASLHDNGNTPFGEANGNVPTCKHD